MHVRIATTSVDEFYNGLTTGQPEKSHPGHIIHLSKIQIYPVCASKYYVSGRLIRRDLLDVVGSCFNTGLFELSPLATADLDLRLDILGQGASWNREYALLLELHEVVNERDNLSGWVMFPLDPQAPSKYRLKLNRPVALDSESLISLIREKKIRIRPSSSYISLEIERPSVVPDGTIVEAIQATLDDEDQDPLSHLRNMEGTCLVPRRKLEFFQSPIPTHSCNLAVFSNSNALIVVCYDQTAFIYRIGADSCGAQLQAESTISCASWFFDDSRIALGCVDGKVILWDAMEGSVEELIHETRVVSLNTLPENRELWVLTESKVVLYRHVSPVIVHAVDRLTHAKYIVPIPNSNSLIISSRGIIRVRQAGMELISLIKIIYASYPFFIGMDCSVYEWDESVSALTLKYKLEGNISSICVSPDRKYVGIGGTNGSITFYSTLLWRLEFESSISLPVAVKGFSWATSHHLLAVIGDADTGSTVPLLILCSEGNDTAQSWRWRWLEAKNSTLSSILGSAARVDRIKQRILESIAPVN